MTIETNFLAKLRNSERPTVSFEFFPPKDEAGLETLRTSFAELQAFNPDFVSVTYGAMGSNQATSLAVVEEFARQVPTIAHLTCIGATEANIAALLGRYETAGVAGVLALRGDVPATFEGDPLGDFQHADQLVALAKQTSKLTVGVAAFPEKHPESASLAEDLEVLQRKEQLGAELAMTQLFFDVDAYKQLVERAQSMGLTLPIVPGLMPIANAKQVMRMADMSGAKIPQHLVDALNSAANETESRAIGMQFSIELGRELLTYGAPGLHIFSLNHHRAASELLHGIGLS